MVRSDSSGGLLLISLLHPMEWIGLETHLALLEHWLLSSRMDGEEWPVEAPAIPAGTRIRSIPVANPDGFRRVDEARRRLRPRWVRGNLHGVDLNRNFPVNWRPRPGWLRFWPLYRPGPHALSEPETAAVAAYARREMTSCSISLHSFGRWLFYPPSTGSVTPLRRTEAHASAALRLAPPGYRTAPLARWASWFRAHGTEIDTLEALTGSPAYLLEIGRSSFGRWGRGSGAGPRPPFLDPFTLFNPPDPAAVAGELVAFLTDLARRALEDEVAPDEAAAGERPARRLSDP